MANDSSRPMFSYMWPGLLFLVGIPFLLNHGWTPYRDLLRRRNWIPLRATLERGLVVSEDAPDSMVLKDTGTQYKVKLILKYSPRSLFGPAALNPRFPPWLMLPKVMFHWTLSPETYGSVMDAHAALRTYQSIRDFELYINPGRPEQATMFLWNNWLWIGIGLTFWILAILGIAFIWILNSRAVRHLVSEEEELARFRERRHHRRGQEEPPPPPGYEPDEEGDPMDTIHE